MKNVYFIHKRDRLGSSRPLIALRSVFVVLVLAVSSSLFALPGTPPDSLLTFSFVDAPLRDVFAQIEKDSKFTFEYKTDIDFEEKVTFSVQNEPIDSLMNRIPNVQGLLFEIDGQEITIYKKEPVSFAPRHTVRGTVTDAYGEPIFCASVLIKGSAHGTVSDSKGKFELPVDGTVTLVVSFGEMKAIEILAHPEQKLKVVLQ